MDERTIQAPAELPVTRAAHPGPGGAGLPAADQAGERAADQAGERAGDQVGERTADRAGLADPRALTILTTEHWSLLSARALVYNEAFARAGMFLTFLSATLVALGLVANGVGFRREFLLIAAGVLALDLFVGVATIGRVAAATSEDLRYLQGMNRVRHAYHETVPGLERYFVSGRYDDLPGVFSIYTTSRPMTRSGTLHGLTTTPGMLAVICAAVAGTLAGVLVLLATDLPAAAGVVALLVLAAGALLGLGAMNRMIAAMSERIDVHFPSPRA